MSTRAFKNDAASIREARRFVAQALAGASEEVVEVAELMVSELATNCVRHAGSEFEVAVIRTARDVRVQVTDPAAGEPMVRSPAPEDPTGRGLRIVEALSREWGIERVPPGKAVWFTLDTATAAGGAPPLAAGTSDGEANGPGSCGDTSARGAPPEPARCTPDRGRVSRTRLRGLLLARVAVPAAG